MRRITKQRKVILEEVCGSHTHPTADEVYGRVRQHLPRISLGTVYRNLDLLTRDGLIRTIEGAGSRRYDGDLKEHWHVRCTECGRISDIEPETEAPLDSESSLPDGFLVTGWHVEYQGICVNCRAKGEGRRAKNLEKHWKRT